MRQVVGDPFSGGKQRFTEITWLAQGPQAEHGQSSPSFPNVTINTLCRLNCKKSQVNLTLILPPSWSGQICCNFPSFCSEWLSSQDGQRPHRGRLIDCLRAPRKDWKGKRAEVSYMSVRGTWQDRCSAVQGWGGVFTPNPSVDQYSMTRDFLSTQCSLSKHPPPFWSMTKV